MAAYPGGNGKLAFVSDRDDFSGIYVMNPDGSGMNDLALAFPDYLGEPVWSPNGNTIAFINDSDGVIRVMNADGSGKTTLAVGRSPTWSPDGARIAYIGYASGWGVYVMDADGTDQTKLYDASPTLNPEALAWSPDGAALVVSGTDGIRLANADGSGGITFLGQGANANWSPDGMRIVFARSDGGDSEIHVMDRDGTDVVPITNNDVSDNFPAWSPDGTKIAFETESDDGYDVIAVVDVDGSGLRILTPHFSTNTQPDWQPLWVVMRASRSIVDYGGSLTINAHLVWFETTTNANLSLFKIPSGGSKMLVASKVVDGAGDSSFRVKPEKRTTYVLEWAGDDTHAATSVTVLIQVRARTTTGIFGFYARSGRYALYRLGSDVVQRGKVAPNHAGKRLAFMAQRRVGGSWRDVADATFRIRANGSVTARLTPGSRATYRVRNTFLADRDHLRDSSAWLYFKVT